MIIEHYSLFTTHSMLSRQQFHRYKNTYNYFDRNFNFAGIFHLHMGSCLEGFLSTIFVLSFRRSGVRKAGPYVIPGPMPPNKISRCLTVMFPRSSYYFSNRNWSPPCEASLHQHLSIRLFK